MGNSGRLQDKTPNRNGGRTAATPAGLAPAPAAGESGPWNATATTSRPGVEQAFSDLDTSLDALAAAVERAGVQLFTVLRPLPPGGPESPLITCGSPITCRLIELNDRLKAQTHALNTLIENLDL